MYLTINDTTREELSQKLDQGGDFTAIHYKEITRQDQDRAKGKTGFGVVQTPGPEQG